MQKRESKNNVHFNTDYEEKKSKQPPVNDWIQFMKKDSIISLLLHKKWSSRTQTELKKMKVDDLRIKLEVSLQRYASLQDIQVLKEKIISDRYTSEEKKLEKLQETRKCKSEILKFGKVHFIPGAIVQVFDERKKSGKIYDDPIMVRVIEQSEDGKIVDIEFLETRPWNEAGGHMIYRGQKMRFKFVPITFTWLREGLTSEVVRSYGYDNKSVYFQLSYTRQYLLLPKKEFD